MTDTLIAALYERYHTVCASMDPSVPADREAMAEAEALRLRIMVLPAAGPGDLVHKLDILVGMAEAGAVNEDLEAWVHRAASIREALREGKGGADVARMLNEGLALYADDALFDSIALTAQSILADLARARAPQP